MRPSVLSVLALTVACELSFMVTGSPGQQSASSPSTASGASRRGYYARVQTQSGGSSRPDASRSRYASGRASFTRNAITGEYESRRTSTASAASGDTPRPYERAPVVSPPQREMPAPVVSHDYYPGLRAGQSANRNVVSHCVPGRNSFLHR